MEQKDKQANKYSDKRMHRHTNNCMYRQTNTQRNEHSGKTYREMNTEENLTET